MAGSTGDDGARSLQRRRRRASPGTPSASAARADSRRAGPKPLPDVLAPDLDVLFCGINPSLTSAAVGHHFARPGNRFWPAIHVAGLTPRRLTPATDRELPRYGLGSTNIVDRPTRTAAELTADELRAGLAALADLVAVHRPRVLAGHGLSGCAHAAVVA